MKTRPRGVFASTCLESIAVAAGLLRRVALEAALVGIVAVSFPSDAGAWITGVVMEEKVARLTGAEGPESINPTWKVGVRGTDLGHMVQFKDRIYFIFGDTFDTELAQMGGEAPKHNWRWNTIAYTTDTLAADGITFTGWVTNDQGIARQVVRDKRMNPITNIPTGGIAVGDRMYLWYMAMSFWGTVEDPCWRSHYAGLAWSDDAETFTIQEDFLFPEGSNFGMVAAAMGDDDPALRDGYVYIWGTPSSRCGGVKLARVRPEDIARKSEWRFYGGSGKPGENFHHRGTESQRESSQEATNGEERNTASTKERWVKSEDEATTIVAPRVGEMSVMYNEWAGVWTMLYMTFLEGQNPMLTTGRIVLRQSETPWGPWSDPIEVVVPNIYLGGFYGSYMNKAYVENKGETVYFTMSLWDPYDVYLWKAKFRK